MSVKYHVVVFYEGEAFDRTYLTHKDRDSWSKRVAMKHAKEFTAMHGNRAEIKEA